MSRTKYDGEPLSEKYPEYIPSYTPPTTRHYGDSGEQKYIKFGTTNKNLTAGYGSDSLGSYVFGNLNLGDTKIPNTINTYSAPIGDFSLRTDSQSPNITAMYEPNELGNMLYNTLLSAYKKGLDNYNNNQKSIENYFRPGLPDIPMILK